MGERAFAFFFEKGRGRGREGVKFHENGKSHEKNMIRFFFHSFVVVLRGVVFQEGKSQAVWREIRRFGFLWRESRTRTNYILL